MKTYRLRKTPVDRVQAVFWWGYTMLWFIGICYASLIVSGCSGGGESSCDGDGCSQTQDSSQDHEQTSQIDNGFTITINLNNGDIPIESADFDTVAGAKAYLNTLE